MPKFKGPLLIHDILGGVIKKYLWTGCFLPEDGMVKMLIKVLRLLEDPNVTDPTIVLVDSEGLHYALGKGGILNLAKCLFNTDEFPENVLRGECVELGPTAKQWLYIVLISDKDVRRMLELDIDWSQEGSFLLKIYTSLLEPERQQSVPTAGPARAGSHRPVVQPPGPASQAPQEVAGAADQAIVVQATTAAAAPAPCQTARAPRETRHLSLTKSSTKVRKNLARVVLPQCVKGYFLVLKTSFLQGVYCSPYPRIFVAKAILQAYEDSAAEEGKPQRTQEDMEVGLDSYITEQNRKVSTKEKIAATAAAAKAAAAEAAAEAASLEGATNEPERTDTDEEEVEAEIEVNAAEKRMAYDWRVNMGDACKIDEPGPPASPGKPDNPRTPIGSERYLQLSKLTTAREKLALEALAKTQSASKKRQMAGTSVQKHTTGSASYKTSSGSTTAHLSTNALASLSNLLPPSSSPPLLRRPPNPPTLSSGLLATPTGPVGADQRGASLLGLGRFTPGSVRSANSITIPSPAAVPTSQLLSASREEPLQDQRGSGIPIGGADPTAAQHSPSGADAASNSAGVGATAGTSGAQAPDMNGCDDLEDDLEDVGTSSGGSKPAAKPAIRASLAATSNQAKPPYGGSRVGILPSEEDERIADKFEQTVVAPVLRAPAPPPESAAAKKKRKAQETAAQPVVPQVTRQGRTSTVPAKYLTSKS